MDPLTALCLHWPSGRAGTQYIFIVFTVPPTAVAGQLQRCIYICTAVECKVDCNVSSQTVRDRSNAARGEAISHEKWLLGRANEGKGERPRRRGQEGAPFYLWVPEGFERGHSFLSRKPIFNKDEIFMPHKHTQLVFLSRRNHFRFSNDSAPQCAC